MSDDPGFDLYPRSREAFDLALFRHPSAEYRGAPFWSINGPLDRAELFRQLDVFKQMGMGGVHFHVRTGLTIPYLGDVYMEHVRACVDYCRQIGLTLWLYDEDRWPSGGAGGLVTKADPSLRRKQLLVTRRPNEAVAADPWMSGNSVERAGNGTLVARFGVELRNGVLHRYRRLADGEGLWEGADLWYAYLEDSPRSPWFNGQAPADVMNPRAVGKFIELTHERYRATVGEAFGGTVPAIFTDEPQVARKTVMARPDDTADQFLPWTGDFGDSYAAAFGERLEDRLPELLWDSPDGHALRTRHRYFDHFTERFVVAFSDQLGDWCDRHRLALTGHYMSEENLVGQATITGEVMRHYRRMHLPGIDLLCDNREYSTAKQCQSAARQYGRCGAMSELYGSTNWDFPLAGHKGQGDWQAVCGITVRVHHLAWMTMYGDAKRDWPASIFYQMPWWKEYSRLEDHFARLNVAMTRGRPLCRVGMIHPIETWWISSGPRSQNGLWQQQQEEAFQQGVHWLLMGMIDFDFIAESLLPSLCPQAAGPQLQVGEMAYDAVVVPPLRTIRSTTLDRLESFAGGGGTVIFAGEVPTLVDALPSERALRLASRCRRVGWSRMELLGALDPHRHLAAESADGRPTGSLIYQLREDHQDRWLLIANVDGSAGVAQARLKVRGEWSGTLLDTFSGETHPLPTDYSGDETIIVQDIEAAGHLLLRLEPGRSAAVPNRVAWKTIGELPAPTQVTLDEPNVLLLDQADYRLDSGPWQPREEHLRIHNAARVHFGLAPIGTHVMQPWADTEPAVTLGSLSLRYVIECDTAVAEPMLALEDVGMTTLTLDGQPIAPDGVGWWVDPCLSTLRLPALSPGRHELVLTRPFNRRSYVERCYVLGDFGVYTAGRFARITAPVRNLEWGDWTHQGLPFYAGNVTYHCPVTQRGPIAIRIPHHAAPLLKVENVQAMVPPYRAVLASPGDAVAITAFGNRFNAFGNLHLADPTTRFHGPSSFRTTGDAWSHEYRLKPMGVLSAPVIEQPG